MLPSELVDNFHRLFSAECLVRDQVLIKQFVSNTSEFLKRGILQSSMAALASAEIAAEELKVRASMAYNELLKTASAYGVELDDEFRADGGALIVSVIDGAAMQLRAMALEQPTMKWGDRAPNALEILDQAAQAAKDKLLAELDRTIAQARTRAVQTNNMSGGNSFNITGPVGIIQTGMGSMAVLSQHVDCSTKMTLRQVLERVREDVLVTPDSALPTSKAEIVETVEACLEQLDKERPNQTMLRWMLSGLGETIGAVASLQPAYETFKGALSLIGVTLP